MTVITQESFVTYTGNGATTLFPFGFMIQTGADVVTLWSEATGPVQLSPSAYSITGLDNPSGGSVTYPLTGPAISSSYTITIQRILPVVQSTDISNQANFYPVVIEDALDYLTYLYQQLAFLSDRAVLVPIGDLNPPADYLSDVQEDAAAAAAAASAAAASAAAAASSAGQLQGFIYNIMSFGAVGDGVTNDAPALQSALNTIAALPHGGRLYCPPGIYALADSITGKSNVVIDGGSAIAPWGDGATFLNTQSGTSPMFAFASLAHGWCFKNIRLDGNNKNAPIISAVEGSGATAYGSYGVQIINVQFYRGRPAIYAQFSFDWIIENCFFDLCGNVATGTGSQVASIYLFNGVNTGGNCNNFHIINNFFDTTVGYGIYSDATGAAANPNSHLYISFNHFEATSGVGTGVESVYGCLSSAYISNNLFQLTYSNFITFTNTVVSSGNLVSFNRFFNPANYALSTASRYDLIQGNFSYKSGNNVAHYQLAAGSVSCRVIGNTITAGATPVAVLNSGTFNDFYDNTDGTEQGRAVKFWASVGVSAGVPAIRTSYNVTSITDTGVGQLTVTLTRNFASSNWMPHVSVGVGATPVYCNYGPPAAGSILAVSRDKTDVLTDPVFWSVSGMGY